MPTLAIFPAVMLASAFLPPPALGLIGDIGGPELLLILVLVLILFGGKSLPDFARGLGKSLREFKRATSGVEEEIRRAMEEPPPPVRRLPPPPPPAPIPPEVTGEPSDLSPPPADDAAATASDEPPPRKPGTLPPVEGG